MYIFLRILRYRIIDFHVIVFITYAIELHLKTGWKHIILIHISEYIYDLAEQKHPNGTTPRNAISLPPESTFIDEFSKVIPDSPEYSWYPHSYDLKNYFWKPLINCGAGTERRGIWWIRQNTPIRTLLLTHVN